MSLVPYDDSDGEASEDNAGRGLLHRKSVKGDSHDLKGRSNGSSDAFKVDVCPKVSSFASRIAHTDGGSSIVAASSGTVAISQGVHDSEIPIGGPLNPFRRNSASVSLTFVDEVAFDEEYYSGLHGAKGTNAAVLGVDQDSRAAGIDVSRKRKHPTGKSRQDDSKLRDKISASMKQKSLEYESVPWVEASDDENFEDEGENVDVDGELVAKHKSFVADFQKKREEAEIRVVDEKYATSNEKEVKVMDESDIKAASSEFHLSSAVDYQFRSWVTPPRTLRPDAHSNAHNCLLPKKLKHTWRGHEKGVQTIVWFPKYAHLLLSGSLDSTCKIWGVCEEEEEKERGEKRTYKGHSAPISKVAFNSTGTSFASSGYDERLIQWDVESGTALTGFNMGCTVNCLVFYPEDDHILMAGCADRTIHQIDLRQGKSVQQYRHHLQAVNTITFFDQNRRFLSTSDDKAMLSWEMNLPVPIKYVQDPSMQSMPVVRHHPVDQYVACQSMDNQILTFEVGDRVRSAKRKFRGHNNAGFACSIDFSPDGKYICSGDSHGRLFFWNWRNGRKCRELKVHDKQPCLGVLWHPIEPSWVATSAWDGLIKLWE